MMDGCNEVFLLGAGFSKAITTGTQGKLTGGLAMPLGSELLTKAYLEIGPQSSHDISWYLNHPVQEVLLRDFDCFWSDSGYCFKRLGSTQPADLEIVITHCRLQARNPVLSLGERQKYSETLEKLENHLASVLYFYPYIDSNVLRRLDQFLTIMKAGSYIFTTNFDDILDFDWLRMVDTRKFPILSTVLLRESEEPRSMLKSGLLFNVGGGLWIYRLHGGVRFSACTNSKCSRFEEPTREFTESEFCTQCGAEMTMGMMPPTVSKDYSQAGYYSSVLRQLSECVLWAQVVTIIGYSFPIHDSVLRSTVINNLAVNEGCQVNIVDPNSESIASSFKNSVSYLKVKTHASLGGFLKSRLQGN